MSRNRISHLAGIALITGVAAAGSAAGLLPAASLAQRAAAVASTACRQHEAKLAIDNDESTHWCADTRTRSGWVELDLGREVKVSRAVIHEGGTDEHVRRFQLQARVNGQWETISFGGFIGRGRELSFEPVSTRFVRLTICEASGAPAISEIRLFER